MTTMTFEIGNNLAWAMFFCCLVLAIGIAHSGKKTIVKTKVNANREED